MTDWLETIVQLNAMSNEPRWGARGFPVIGSFVLHGLLLVGALIAQRQSVPVAGVPGALTERVLHGVEVSAFNEPRERAQPAVPAPAAAPEESEPTLRGQTSVKARPSPAAVKEVIPVEREDSGGWLGIAKPAQEDPPPDEVREAPRERDVLVERLLAKERSRSERFRTGAFTSASPEAAAAPGLAAPAVSAGNRANATTPGDLWASLTQALPAALNPAVWNDRRARAESSVRLEARLRDGKLIDLKAAPPVWAGVESLRSNLFELLKRAQFSSSGARRGETSDVFEVRVRVSMQQDTELPALGYSAPPGGTEGTAYVIFPSGLRLDAVVRRL